MLNVTEKFNISHFHVDKHVEEGLATKQALYYGTRIITYGELQLLVNRAGNSLLELGIGMEDRVMIALPERPEHIAFFLGAMKIGAVPFCVNHQSSPSLMEYFLNDSRAKVAVVDSFAMPDYSIAKPKLNFLKNEIILDGGKNSNILKNSSCVLDAADTNMDDMAYWVYTSGTTGTPRAAVHCHRDLAFCALTFAEKVLNATKDDVFYSTSRLGFSFGRMNTMHVPLLLGASAVLENKPLTPDLVYDNFQRFGVTLFFSVPTFYNRIVSQSESRGENRLEFPKLRLCVAAGEPLPSVVYHKWISRFGVELVNGYGSSEAEYICISQLPGQVKPDSTGKLLPGWEAKIVDGEGNKITLPGVAGTLWIKSASTAFFYWHKRDASRKSFVGEWYNTGDIFRMDADGYYYFDGRADDMFKSSGMWVSPPKVENVLLNHGLVAEAAVVGIPEESGLIKSMAFVVLKKEFRGSPDLGDGIRKWLGTQLHSYEVPGSIIFVEQLPKTSAGKIQRYLLRSEIKV